MDEVLRQREMEKCHVFRTCLYAPGIALKNLTKHGFDTSCDSADGEVEATNWIPSETISTALNDDCLKAKGLVDILKNPEMGLDTNFNIVHILHRISINLDHC